MKTYSKRIKRLLREYASRAHERESHRELAEFERVVRPGGHIIHGPGTAEWGYMQARYQESDGWKRKYWKERP